MPDKWVIVLADASYFCNFVEPESSLRKSYWVLKYKQTRKKRNKLYKSDQMSKNTVFFCVMVSNDVFDHIRKDSDLHSDIKN